MEFKISFDSFSVFSLNFHLDIPNLSFPFGSKQNLCDFLERRIDFPIFLVIKSVLLRNMTHLQAESSHSDGEILAGFAGPG